jgi:hypothetical protein
MLVSTPRAIRSQAAFRSCYAQERWGLKPNDKQFTNPLLAFDAKNGGITHSRTGSLPEALR